MKKVFLLIFITAAIVTAGDDPKELIIKKDGELKTAISSYRKTPSEENKKKVISLINNVFDFKIIGIKALPREILERADTNSRDAFIKEFSRMVENSSVKKLELYQSDSVFYSMKVTGQDSATVSANMWYKGQKTLLQYKMVRISTEWKSCDLLIDDLSTVRNYRDQFKTILENKTLNELTAMLKKKADETN